MSSFKISLLSSLFLLVSHFSFAQSQQKETFKVAGECGMCKKKIETAAKNAGATYAVWSPETKKMTVKYSSTTSVSKIQQNIAAVGYDTPNFKASDEAYKQLHECCQYERTTAKCCEAHQDDKACCVAGANCCKDGCHNDDNSCCADGKCSKDTACAEKNSDCCKKA